MKAYGLSHKSVLHVKRPSLETKFKPCRLKGKHLEQEQESQGKLPRKKNQVRRTGDTGQEESRSEDSQAGVLHTRAPKQPHPKDL